MCHTTTVKISHKTVTTSVNHLKKHVSKFPKKKGRKIWVNMSLVQMCSDFHAMILSRHFCIVFFSFMFVSVCESLCLWVRQCACRPSYLWEPCGAQRVSCSWVWSALQLNRGLRKSLTRLCFPTSSCKKREWEWEQVFK